MPLVCITGDVHHHLGHPCHPLIPAPTVQKNEYMLANDYSNVLRRHDLKATLFVTGKCIALHKSFWTAFQSLDFIELGAHTHTAFQPFIIHKFFQETLNTRYGPSFYQYLDIKRTLNAFKSIGLKPKTWRTHAYEGTSVTYRLLERCGFSIVSDAINLGNLSITQLGALKHVPITTLPDEKVAYFYFQGMTSKMTAEGQRVLNFITDSILNRKDMVITLHPIGGKVLDNFRSFEKISEMLSEHGYTSVTITQLVNRLGCEPHASNNLALKEKERATDTHMPSFLQSRSKGNI